MKFAKLFDVADGHQVLYRLTENELEQPCVRIETCVNHIEVSVCTAFTDVNGDVADTKAAKFLEMANQSNADGFFIYALQVLGAD